MKFIAIIILFLWASSIQAADLDNGDDLHFEHCTGGYDFTVNSRDNRNVRDLPRLG